MRRYRYTALGLISAITFTGSKVATQVYGEVVLPQQGQLLPLTDQSGAVINMDAFRADPRFAGIDGSGYAAVILDTGIDLDHPFFGPDLDANGVADRIVYNQDFVGGDPNAQDVDGHGSNVSSIVAGYQPGVYQGMATGADIIHLQVLNDFGGGSFGALENALQWVVASTSSSNPASASISDPVQTEQTIAPRSYWSRSQFAASHQRPFGPTPSGMFRSATITASKRRASPNLEVGATRAPIVVRMASADPATIRGLNRRLRAGSPVICSHAVPTDVNTSCNP